MGNLRDRLERWVPAVALAAGLGCATPSGAAAQQGPRLLCATPGPLQECRSFILMEVSGQSPFAPAARKSLHQSLGWNLGIAANVAAAWAIGGVVGYEFATESTHHRTASLRIRRWLTPSIGLELAPGVFQLVDKGYDPDDDRTGYSASLNVLLFDVGLVGLRLDALPERSGSASEYAVSAAGGLQSLPALVGTALGGLLVLVALGAAISAAG